MKKSQFTNEQIAFALRLAESGVSVEEVCRSSASASRRFTAGRRSLRGWGLLSCVA